MSISLGHLLLQYQKGNYPRLCRRIHDRCIDTRKVSDKMNEEKWEVELNSTCSAKFKKNSVSLAKNILTKQLIMALSP